jgi:predicted nucleic acid-binding protein
MKTYILDTNVFIEAWNKYYSPDIIPTYWEMILDFARNNQVFIPEAVYDELQEKDDHLSQWITDNKFIIENTDVDIQKQLQKILADNLAKLIVNSNKRRNTADPWVVAHAMSKGHYVVTKETLTGRPNDPRIPDVCSVFGINYINDFDMIRELGIKLHATR